MKKCVKDVNEKQIDNWNDGENFDKYVFVLNVNGY